jgi:hypothetical protein
MYHVMPTFSSFLLASSMPPVVTSALSSAPLAVMTLCPAFSLCPFAELCVGPADRRSGAGWQLFVLPLLPSRCLRLQNCVSDQLIDAAVLGGPKLVVVATLASFTPATPYVFRSYELPVEAEQRAAKMGACAGSSKHLVWQVCVRLLSKVREAGRAARRGKAPYILCSCCILLPH